MGYSGSGGGTWEGVCKSWRIDFAVIKGAIATMGFLGWRGLLARSRLVAAAVVVSRLKAESNCLVCSWEKVEVELAGGGDAM